MIGIEAGVCWNSNIKDEEKNYKRGLNCLSVNHGRTFEYPDVYMIIEGYSARVIREWYTHIGGSPTRLQASTRYIDYNNFDYIIPPTIKNEAEIIYKQCMQNISDSLIKLQELNIPKEDIANLLPLGMTTKIVCKHNLRNLMDMSRQRMCNKAYWEYRKLFKEVCEALSEYSEEWKYIVENFFYAKCEVNKKCLESKSCGKYPKEV